MHKEEVLDYISIALANRIRDRIKFGLEQSWQINVLKSDIEYYEKIIEYIKENLK